MSTVGFGDLTPQNDFERILCALIFLIGNGTFAIIIGDITEMIETMKTFNKDNEEAKDLNRFFNLISRYN